VAEDDIGRMSIINDKLSSANPYDVVEQLHIVPVGLKKRTVQ
jgi:hypothetical protein